MSPVSGTARQSDNDSQYEWDLEELQSHSALSCGFEAAGLHSDCRLLISKAAVQLRRGNGNSTGCKAPCSYREFTIFFLQHMLPDLKLGL